MESKKPEVIAIEAASSAAVPTPELHSKKSLLYMYVEDYLGFRQESFNFAMSPRFRMDCDGDKRILVRADPITKHETFWEDHPFFGENISSLSLLIGENGSGKTTVFRLLISWLRDLAKGHLPSLKGMLVFRETKDTKKHPTHQDRCICFPAGTEITLSDSTKHIMPLSCATIQQFLRDVSFTYYTDTMTDLEPICQWEEEDADESEDEANRQFIDRSLNARLCSIPLHPGQKHLTRYELRSLDFAFQVKHLLKMKGENGNKNDGVRPIPIDFLRLSVRTKWEKHPINKLLKELQAEKQAAIADYSGLLDSAKSCFDAWRNLSTGMSNGAAVRLSIVEGVLWSFLSTVLRSADEDDAEIIRTLAAGLSRFNIQLLDLREPYADSVETYDYVKNAVTDYLKNVSGIDRSKESIARTHADLSAELLALDRWIENLPWTTPSYHGENDDVSWTVKVTDLLSDKLNLDVFSGFVKIHSTIPDAESPILLEWAYLSSGEDNQSNLFANLMARRTGTYNQWFFFDEPDNSFHPRWKQTIICQILTYCTAQNDSSFQLWISSHSPIMLSDVPAQAAIRLMRIEETFSKINATEQGNKLSPFAQQIYTLFDDDFFMEKGVVGAFANDTISELYEILKQVERSKATTEKTIQPKMDYIEAVLAQIQEPVLRGYLVNRIQFSREKLSRLARR